MAPCLAAARRWCAASCRLLQSLLHPHTHHSARTTDQTPPPGCLDATRHLVAPRPAAGPGAEERAAGAGISEGSPGQPGGDALDQRLDACVTATSLLCAFALEGTASGHIKRVPTSPPHATNTCRFTYNVLRPQEVSLKMELAALEKQLLQALASSRWAAHTLYQQKVDLNRARGRAGHTPRAVCATRTTSLPQPQRSERSIRIPRPPPVARSWRMPPCWRPSPRPRPRPPTRPPRWPRASGWRRRSTRSGKVRAPPLTAGRRCLGLSQGCAGRSFQA